MCYSWQQLKDAYRYAFKHFKAYLARTKNTKNELECQFANLRMYCHMLDKGLNNPCFERGRGESIYKKASELHRRLKDFFKEDPAFIWAGNIINSYEAAQKNNFYERKNISFKTYSESEKKFISDFIASRTSCINFFSNKIPEDTLQKITSLAIDAPNGCCRQATKFYFSQNSKTINKVSPSIAGITNFSDIPCLVCVTAEANFYPPIDTNLQYIDAALAAENFILAARIHNVYGTMCNFFHATEKDINICKKEFDIPSSENIVLFIAIGFPAALPEKPVRRSLSHFFHVIQ